MVTEGVASLRESVADGAGAPDEITALLSFRAAAPLLRSAYTAGE